MATKKVSSDKEVSSQEDDGEENYRNEEGFGVDSEGR